MDKSALFSAAQSAAQAEGYAVTEIENGSEYVLRFHPAASPWVEGNPEISTWRTSETEVALDPADAEDHIAAALASATGST
tara:strand:- start:2311 stop:2553 length:243 start_codon:yes stop_codon:yes gene_type:complete